MSDTTLPKELREPMQRAVRLEYWNIFWTISIVVVMGSVLGQSQTMKTAWIEDMLGLIPPIAFLVAVWFERRGRRSARFPFGFERANGLGFFVAAVALAAVGASLLWDAVSTLIAAEHASVGSIVIFGYDIWLGWLMLAAQAYSLVPPLIIGRMELPLAETLSDKLIHTDALMNKANWQTGAAGFVGVLGLGLGWWWADSVAAAVISVGIIKDGVDALRSSTAELIDGAPRGLSSNALAGDAKQLKSALAKRFPGASVRVRETGRVIRAEVHGGTIPHPLPSREELWPGDPERCWRLAQVSFAPGDKP
ncbi:MAG: cation transporter [Pseudomonadota bacterium]